MKKYFSVLAMIMAVDIAIATAACAENAAKHTKHQISASSVSDLAASEPRSNKQNTSWQRDKARLEKLGNAGECHKYWDVLWPWAKKGNLEARAALLTLMVPPPHGTQIFAPGNSGDYVSRMRDAYIMAVHSSATQGGYLPKEYQSAIYQLYIDAGFEGAPDGRTFLECVKSKSNKCADIAVQKKLVPSFEEFAKQIDAFSAAGMKSTCESSNK